MAVRDDFVEAKKTALLSIGSNRIILIRYYSYYKGKEDTCYDIWQQNSEPSEGKRSFSRRISRITVRVSSGNIQVGVGGIT